MCIQIDISRFFNHTFYLYSINYDYINSLLFYFISIEFKIPYYLSLNYVGPNSKHFFRERDLKKT